MSRLTIFTAATAEDGFTADTSATNDAWGASGATAIDDEDTGYIGQNVSKHAGTGDDTCRK